ncbi:MAG: deoxyribonuclease V [Dehalococcoidales bacterium]|nr:deoxyribonuclease V [Dehalococcoidales bacterium]
MKIIQRHNWQVTPRQAVEIQKTLAAEVIKTGSISSPRRIAGVDISVNRFSKTGSGAVVVLDYPSLQIAEVQVVKDAVTFPYVPGLLSFREIPLLLQAFEKLKTAPDLVLVDGQGIAHPRRIGLASHLGLILGIPTIGCAKSRLCGEHVVPDIKSGSFTDLTDSGEVIGAVVRTRANVKPLYISIGHLISLPNAIKWVLACCRGCRLPEPTRLAHQAAGGNLKVVVALK